MLLCKYKCSLRESIRELSRTAPESPLRMIYCCIQKGPIPVPPTETAAAPTKNPTNTDHRSAPQEGSALQKIDAPIYTWCALSIANQSTTLQSTGADTMQLKKKTANTPNRTALCQGLEHLLVHNERDGGSGRSSDRVRHATLKKSSRALLSSYRDRAVPRPAIARCAGLHLFGGASLLQP